MRGYKFKYCFAVFLIFVLLFDANANKRFIHIDYLQGLTNLNVTCITQDNEGFMWIGTENGLFKYNGYEFKTYKTEVHDSTSLSNNSITHLLVDSKGRIWVSTRSGLNVYSSVKDDFYRIPIKKGSSKAIPNALIEVTYEDSKGRIWMGHYDGYTLLKNPDVGYDKYVFESHMLVNKSDVENWVCTICEDQQGYIWFGVKYRGIHRLHPETKEIKNYYDPELSNVVFRVQKILRTSKEELIIALFSGEIYRYSYEKDELEKAYYEQNRIKRVIYDIIQSENGDIWMATNAGLQIFNSAEWEEFHHQPEQPESLASEALTSLYEDVAGGIWIGNNGEGLDYSFQPSILIKEINHKTIKDFPRARVIDVVYADDKILLSALYKGGYWYHQNNLKEVNLIRIHDNVIFDGIDRIYSGRSYFDINTKEKGSFPLWSNRVVFKFDEQGNVYYAENYAISSFNRNGEKIIDSIRPILKSDHKKVINFKTFHVLKNNYLLLGNENLYLMDKTSLETSILLSTESLPEVQYGFEEMEIKDKDIWIKSEHILIHFHLDKCLQGAYNLNKEWGDVIYSYTTDNENHMWFTTNKGIVLLNPESQKTNLFNQKDGVSALSFSPGITISPENKIYFSNGEGIVIVDKNSFQPNKYTPPVVFTNFNILIQENSKKENDFQFEKNINAIDKIRLKYFQNYFTIEFASLNYQLSSKNQYKYFLEGLEKDWIKSGNSTKVSYNGIPPGNYIFHLKGSNNDGVWNENERRLEIIITPPFWKTFVFKIIVILIIGLIVLLIFSIRLRNIKRQKEELEKQVRLRTAEIVAQKEEIQTQADNLREINFLLKENQEEIQVQSEELFEANTELQRLNSTKDKFFSIIAHDLKNPFQAIRGFSDVLMRDYKELEEDKTMEYIGFIKNSSETASSLLENLLVWARSQTNRIKFTPDQIKLSEIVNETIHLLKINATNKKIELINNIPENLVAFADKNMITTVLRNLLNNAIKFTPEGGKVFFLGKNELDITEIIIKDTGVGMDEQTRNKLFRTDQQISTSGTSGEAGTGLGLIISKEFLDRNNGTIKVESTIGKGSSFIIHLPVNQHPSTDSEYNKLPPNIKEPQNFGIEKTKHNQKQNIETTEVYPEPVEGYADTRKPLLLITEDTLDIRAGIVAYLKKDYRIVEAGDGEEGLKYALDLVPDIIISDWMMPKMDGIQFCEKVKTNQLTSHIPMIMLTAKSTPTNKIEGFETGADDYMVKPFDYEILKARLKNLIQSRIALQKKWAINASKEEEEIQITSGDQKFMDALTSLIEQQLDNSNFNINDFCKELGTSRSQLYRKVTAITGQSPVTFVKNYRLKKAAKLLKESGQTIAEVMYEVGFSNTSYFAKSFKEVFGVTPSEYIKK